MSLYALGPPSASQTKTTARAFGASPLSVHLADHLLSRNLKRQIPYPMIRNPHEFVFHEIHSRKETLVPPSKLKKEKG